MAKSNLEKIQTHMEKVSSKKFFAKCHNELQDPFQALSSSIFTDMGFDGEDFEVKQAMNTVMRFVEDKLLENV